MDPDPLMTGPSVVSLARRILVRTTAYGGVQASTRTIFAWEKRAVIPDVTLNAGQHTSAEDNYALAA
jgi:hypothetical protein